ncbi:FHA domain-containing protein [Euzebya sp.]|uniref:FHA domain-containing protein n=1 Tax=Euzebya sp. TaxID=1971409 RepID=UPI0035137BEB
MYCTQCGSKNPQGSKFCAQCGTPLSSAQDITTGMLPTSVEELREGADERVDIEGIRRELSPGTALLVSVRGPNVGARFLLDKDVVTVGRHPESDIFLDDITVSRRHAEFRHTPAGLAVADVGSLNGTYVNGTRAEQQTLAHGDDVQVGKFRLQAIIPDATAREPHPAEGS